MVQIITIYKNAALVLLFSSLLAEFNVLTLFSHDVSPLFPPAHHPPRAQEVFRQAMHSAVVRLEVVPSASRERYEKSLIGQLFGNGAGPDGSPRTTKTKEAPPPVKAKPSFKPPENPTMRFSEEVASMEAAVGVSSSSSGQHLKPSPSFEIMWCTRCAAYKRFVFVFRNHNTSWLVINIDTNEDVVVA